MNFAQTNSPSNCLFMNSRILKINDQISLNTCLFTHKALNSKLPSCFDDWFVFSRDSHHYHTRHSNLGTLCLNNVNSRFYGKNSPQNACIKVWNFLQDKLSTKPLSSMNYIEMKRVLTKFFLQSYSDT